jgi:hypothetical protein
MHDQELLRRAQYDQDNGPLDDLYVIPAAHAPSASSGAVNNFPATENTQKTSSQLLRSTTVTMTQVYGSRCIASQHVPLAAMKITWRDTSPS